MSPSNIVVTYDGLSKVVDFGVAKARGRMQTTNAGEVKGKLPYMAPEQLDADPIDRRSDVWALGVMLWEATTGRPLFRGRSEAETVTRVLQGPIPRPSQIVAGYPRALEAAVMGCLERDVARRTPHAAALAEAIESVLHRLDNPSGHMQVSRWMAVHLADKVTARLALELTPPREGLRSTASIRVSKARPWRTPLRMGLVLLAVLVVFALGALLVWRTATNPSRPTEIGGQSARHEDAPAQLSRPGMTGPPAAASHSPPADEPGRIPSNAVNKGATVGAGAAAGAAPARRKRRRSRKAGFGKLSLYVVPSARVWIDGKPVGETPLTLRLRAGRHRVKLRTSDGRTRRVAVTVGRGQWIRRSINFEQGRGATD